MSTLFGTGSWKGGDFINFDNKPPMYSIIAIFDPNDGEYKNSTSQSHVAIYLTSDANAITVVDQNHDNTETLAIHTIPWNSTGAKRRDSSVNYQLVMQKTWSSFRTPQWGSFFWSYYKRREKNKEFRESLLSREKRKYYLFKKISFIVI